MTRWTGSQRLRRAFGSPNFTYSMELCGWGRYLASTYNLGAPVPGAFMPDLESAGCILYWGYNPSVSRLVHATATVEAVNPGARLLVVDPRRTGLASKAEHWLQVRPGTDAGLALGLTRVMLERGWYDEAFVRRWTNAPLLVRTDTGQLLRADEMAKRAGGWGTWRGTCRTPNPSDAWVPDHTAEELRGKSKAARAVVAEMKAAGVLIFTGGLDDAAPVFSVVASSGTPSFTDGPFVESKEHFGGFAVVDVADDVAARLWAGKIAVACGWPQVVRRFQVSLQLPEVP